MATIRENRHEYERGPEWILLAIIFGLIGIGFGLGFLCGWLLT